MTIFTPMRAIRKKCLDCCCGSATEVKNCEIEKCTLWPYRMGHRPQTNEKRGVFTGEIDLPDKNTR